jgi:hypothetical protein
MAQQDDLTEFGIDIDELLLGQLLAQGHQQHNPRKGRY